MLKWFRNKQVSRVNHKFYRPADMVDLILYVLIFSVKQGNKDTPMEINSGI